MTSRISAWVDTSGARSGPAPGATQRAWSQGPRGSEGWACFSVLVREQCMSALGRLVIKAGACRLGAWTPAPETFSSLLDLARLVLVNPPIHPHPSPSVGFISVDIHGLADAVRVARFFFSFFPSWRFASFRFTIFCCGDGAYALNGRERRPLQPPFEIHSHAARFCFPALVGEEEFRQQQDRDLLWPESVAASASQWPGQDQHRDGESGGQASSARSLLACDARPRVR